MFLWSFFVFVQKEWVFSSPKDLQSIMDELTFPEIPNKDDYEVWFEEKPVRCFSPNCWEREHINQCELSTTMISYSSRIAYWGKLSFEGSNEVVYLGKEKYNTLMWRRLPVIISHYISNKIADRCSIHHFLYLAMQYRGVIILIYTHKYINIISPRPNYATKPL